MAKLSKGDTVTWSWGSGTAAHEVKSIFHEKTVRTIKRSEVTRNGTQDDPAICIQQDDGDTVLKLASEVSKA
jgi:hypothetical protein